MGFDFYYELQKWTAKGSLYYVEHRDQEQIIYSTIFAILEALGLKGTLIFKQFQTLYQQYLKESTSIDSLRDTIAKLFLPRVFDQIVLEFMGWKRE